MTSLGVRARLGRILLLTLPFLAAACVSPDSRPVAQPGYECGVGGFDPTQGAAYVLLDEEGRQLRAHWEWTGDADQTLLWVRASATVEGERPLRATDGIGAVTWVRAWTGRSPPPERRLELTSDPADDNRDYSPFVGEFTTDRPEIQRSWTDMAALARGTSTLVALVRDRSGNIVERADIEQAVFTRGEARIAALLEQLRAKAADFRGQCLHVADLYPDIIVT